MRIIRKVWSQGKANQLMVGIPKDSDIKVGDYVEIKKMK